MFYVATGLVVFAFIMRGRLQIVPGKLQSLIEILFELIIDLGKDAMGPKGTKFIPLILTFFFFILTSNALSLIPGLYPPTANLNTTAALGLMVFILYNVVGFMEHGVGYIKQFMGPIPILAPIMFPIELMGHLARPVSLSFRLFGNLFGHELLMMVLLVLMPFSLPLLMFSTVLGVVVVVLQAFIFSLLTMVYLGIALEEAH
jgi:F-type H+-transporting ATPase subunit a